MKTDRTRRMLECLGDRSRFRVAATLAAGERCVTDVARAVGLSQSCTTRHLQALTRCGIVRGQRDGKRVVFRLRSDEPEIASLVSWALRREVEAGPGLPPPRRPARKSATRSVPTAGRPHSPTAIEPRPDLMEESADPRTPDRAEPAEELEDFLL